MIKWNLKAKVIAIALFPTLFALFLALQIGFSKSVEVDRSEFSRKLVAVSLLLDDVVHQHAVERGLSVGFVGSKGAKGRDNSINSELKPITQKRAFFNLWSYIMTSTLFLSRACLIEWWLN